MIACSAGPAALNLLDRGGDLLGRRWEGVRVAVTPVALDRRLRWIGGGELFGMLADHTKQAAYG